MCLNSPFDGLLDGFQTLLLQTTCSALYAYLFTHVRVYLWNKFLEGSYYIRGRVHL